MYRWVVARRERRVLEEAEWRTLTTPPQPPAMEAFGWHVETTPDGRARISKGGGSDDFASQLLYYPRDDVVIVWASNNLRQRWRQTLNQALPALVFADNAILLPPVVPITPAQLRELRGRYVSGTDTLDINAGAGYLYAATNRLDVSTTVMFFPQDNSHFTGFDPASRAFTRLEFGRAGSRSLSIELANGRRLSLQR